MSNSVFKNSKFNPVTDHNARFVKKSFNLDINTLSALENWVKDGGVITVCKAGKRSRANISFPLVRGTIANRGAKQVNLTRYGVKAKG